MAIYNDFDINTAATPKPWGAREEQVIKDIIDTLVGDTIDGVKQTSGHLHGKLYNSSSVAKIDVDSAAFVSVSAPIAMGANAISYDGTAGFGIFFNSSNEIFLHDVTHYSNSYDQFYSGNSEPLIYASEDVGASYPFLEAGHLVLQTRQTAARDILFVCGATPAVTFRVDDVGNISNCEYDGFSTASYSRFAYFTVNTDTGTDNMSLEVSGSITATNTEVAALYFSNQKSAASGRPTARISAYTGTTGPGYGELHLQTSLNGVLSTSLKLDENGDLDVANDAVFNQSISLAGSGGTLVFSANGNEIIRGEDTAYTTISGGNTVSLGGNLIMYGSTHATLPSVFRLRQDTVDIIYADTAGLVGIKTALPSVQLDVNGAARTVGSLDVQSADYTTGSILMGAAGGLTTRPNNTNMLSFLISPSYNNTEEHATMLFGVMQQTNNDIRIGGGSSAYNCATRVQFYTGAINTTAGTEIGRFTSTGFNVYGTTDITGTLDVDNQVRINEEGLLLNRSTGAGYVQFTNGSGTSQWAMQRNATGNELNVYNSSGGAGLFHIRASFGGTSRFSVDSVSGNVGIANSTPSTSAHAEYGNLVVGNTSLATSGITCQSSTSGVCSIVFNDSDAGIQGVIQYHNQVDRMDFRTANTQAIRIDSSQNVGIGSGATTPTAKVDIDGNTFRLRTARTITNATDAGNAGDICWNNGYIFVCVATNTWLRAAITTW